MLLAMNRLIASLFLFLTAIPAVAAETDWVEIAEDVSIRLVSSDIVTQDGTIWMGLEIDMPETTKTYWRIPGEAGLPMVIDTLGSRGVADLEIAWPYPTRETAQGYLDHAIYGHVLFPLSVTIGADDPLLVADITMGICSEVCVPATVQLELAPSFDEPDNANALRIRQALATVPLPHDGEGLLGNARYDVEQGALVVGLSDPDFDPSSMIAEIAGSSLIFGVPELNAEQAVLSFPLLGRVEIGELDGASARFTFDTSNGPYQIMRPLSAE